MFALSVSFWDLSLFYCLHWQTIINCIKLAQQILFIKINSKVLLHIPELCTVSLAGVTHFFFLVPAKILLAADLRSAVFMLTS